MQPNPVRLRPGDRCTCCPNGYHVDRSYLDAVGATSNYSMESSRSAYQRSTTTMQNGSVLSSYEQQQQRSSAYYSDAGSSRRPPGSASGASYNGEPGINPDDEGDFFATYGTKLDRRTVRRDLEADENRQRDEEEAKRRQQEAQREQERERRRQERRRRKQQQQQQQLEEKQPSPRRLSPMPESSPPKVSRRAPPPPPPPPPPPQPPRPNRRLNELEKLLPHLEEQFKSLRDAEPPAEATPPQKPRRETKTSTAQTDPDSPPPTPLPTVSKSTETERPPVAGYRTQSTGTDDFSRSASVKAAAAADESDGEPVQKKPAVAAKQPPPAVPPKPAVKKRPLPLLSACVGTDPLPPPPPPPPPPPQSDASVITDPLPPPPPLTDSSVVTDPLLPPPPQSDASVSTDAPPQLVHFGQQISASDDPAEVLEDSIPAPPAPLAELAPPPARVPPSEAGLPPILDDPRVQDDDDNNNGCECIEETIIPERANVVETGTSTTFSWMFPSQATSTDDLPQPPLPEPPAHSKPESSDFEQQFSPPPPPPPSSLTDTAVSTVRVLTNCSDTQTDPLPSPPTPPSPPPTPSPSPAPVVSVGVGDFDVCDVEMATKSCGTDGGPAAPMVTSNVECRMLKLVDVGSEFSLHTHATSARDSGSFHRQEAEATSATTMSASYRQKHEEKQQILQQRQQLEQAYQQKLQLIEREHVSTVNHLRSVITELERQVSTYQSTVVELKQQQSAASKSIRRRNVGLIVKPSCRDVGINFVAEEAKPSQRSVGIGVELQPPAASSSSSSRIEESTRSSTTRSESSLLNSVQQSSTEVVAPAPPPPPVTSTTIISQRHAAQTIIQQLHQTYGISTVELVNLISQLLRRDVRSCGLQVSPETQSLGTAAPDGSVYTESKGTGDEDEMRTDVRQVREHLLRGASVQAKSPMSNKFAFTERVYNYEAATNTLHPTYRDAHTSTGPELGLATVQNASPTRIGNQQVRVESSSHSTTVNRAQTQSASVFDWSVAGPRPYARTQIPMRGSAVPDDLPIRRYSGDHGDDDNSMPTTPETPPRSILSAAGVRSALVGGNSKSAKTVTFDAIEVVRRIDEQQHKRQQPVPDAASSDSASGSTTDDSSDSTAGGGDASQKLCLTEQLIKACDTFATWHEDSTTISARDLNEALAVVKAEWFRLCCNRPVNEVTDFMDRVGARSTQLLEKMVNFSDENGNTSLHYAVSQSNWALVRALLSSGLIRVADLTNKSGYSAPMLVGLCRLPSSTLDSNGEAEDSRSAARDLLASAGDINAKSVRAAGRR
ncbi:hypothetical protein BOX15_Mlig033573g1 [Macrostomum lignano]|uniref:Uncharacterized protein n=1 Tax=Macrostomum lignano TaxID=282301 RepID=A0A267GHZ6_9PLAT|nr:hypothetical protein BOX15_Mlig033573g1 [Macrostomum lignano]